MHLAVAFVGCGGGGDTSIEGCWKLKSSITTHINEDTSEIETHHTNFPINKYPGDDEAKKVWYDNIFRLNKGEMCVYDKYTYINIKPEDLSLLEEEGIPKEGVYYDPNDVDKYTIDKNIVTYTYDSDDEKITVTMKFAITGKTATIIEENAEGDIYTKEVVKVDASVVEGAKEWREEY